MKALIARKSVRPLSSHRLALRYTSHHLDHFTSGSSLSHSSLDHSSSGHSISGHSLPGHSSPDTTVADSSTPPRFVYLPVARTLQCSEAYLCWRSTSLSTMYPSTTSKSSAGDSSFESSAGPSRRSLATTVTSSIHTTRALVPSCADLLPPRKRFRDSISLEDSVKEDNCYGCDEVEDEVGSSDRGTIEVGEDVVVGIDIPDGMLIPDAVEHLESIGSYYYTGKRSENGDIAFKALGFSSIMLCIDFGIIVEPVNMTITHSGMTPEAIEELVNRRVEEALAAYEATRAANALEAEKCTYQDFMKCQPLNFKGMEGVVRLIRWFEKMETIFHISNCPEKYQVKYATCTLLNSALTWWNSHKRTIGTDAAFTMTWRELMKQD
ncbi:hypothetical protein Tco_0493304 [Tanacetum coccineum]